MGQKCSCFDILKPKKKLQATPNVEVPLQSMVYVKNNNPISNVRLRNDAGNLMGDREYVCMKSEPLIPKKKPDEMRDKEPNFEIKDRMLILGPSKDGISIATKDWPFAVPDSTGFVDSKTLSGGFETANYCHDLPYVSSQPKLAFLDNDARNNENGSPINFSPRSSEILPEPSEMNESFPPTPLPKSSEVFPRASEMDENFPVIPPRINQGNSEVFSKPFKINETLPASLPDVNPRSNDFSLDPFKMDDVPRLD